MARISVVINTYNEEKNISKCLQNVSWADEIIVIDMYSEDRTVEIAKTYTDKIFYHEKTGYVEPARQYGISKASNEWVLVLDADELVSFELKSKLDKLADSGSCDVVWIPRTNYIFGKKMKAGGSGPLQDIQLRFFKKDTVNYSVKIHSFPKIQDNARVYKISDPAATLIHLAYPNAETYLNKLNIYTTKEAEYLFKSGEKFSAFQLLYSIFKEIIFRFILKMGFRDGIQGICICILQVAYKVSAYLKLYLMDKFNAIDTVNSVEKEYEKIADSYKFSDDLAT